jgi:hypothetical protein
MRNCRQKRRLGWSDKLFLKIATARATRMQRISNKKNLRRFGIEEIRLCTLKFWMPS